MNRYTAPFRSLSSLFSARRGHEKARLEYPLRWLDLSIRAAADLGENGLHSTKLGLYQFFEREWRGGYKLDTPSELMMRRFWDCSDEKLQVVTTSAALSSQTTLRPHPASLARDMIAAAALAEVNARRFSASRFKSHAIDIRARVLLMLDKFCPTLDADILQSRFPDVDDMSKLYPFDAT